MAWEAGDKSRAFFAFLLVLSACVFFSGCAEQEKTAETAVGSSVPLGVSPLPKGGVDQWTDEAFDEAYGKAREGGFSVAVWRNQWGDIERSAGEYAWADLDYQVYKTEQHGLKYSLIIEVIHTNTLGMYPEDVSFTGFDDPVFVGRFKAFIRRLLERYEGKIGYLWVGNEVDMYLHDDPGQAKPFLAFCREVEGEVKSVDSNITFGVVGSYHLARNNGEVEMLRELGEVGDAVGLTVYLEDDGSGPDVSDTQSYFDELMSRFPGRKVAIIETAWSSRGDKGSEEKQAEYVRELGEVVERHEERLVFFSWLLLYDLHGEANRKVAESFGVDADAPEARRFLEWQGSLGLLENGGREKPAWRTWKENMLEDAVG